jgi:hypothetical protein
MPFLVTMLFIGVVAFASFCFYCGVVAIKEKIEADGLVSFLEWTAIVYIIIAIIMLLTGKVSNVIFRDMPISQSRTFQV